jgi:hypothetical protein
LVKWDLKRYAEARADLARALEEIPKESRDRPKVEQWLKKLDRVIADDF